MAKKLQRKIRIGPKEESKASPGFEQLKTRGLRLLPQRRKVPVSKLSEFTVQLATLLDAGIPIVRALRILEGQLAPGPFKETLKEITIDVESGSSLSEAMEKHEWIFNKLYTNMVRAGEMGGVQDVILLRLADFMSKMQAIRSKVKGALAYPVVVITVALIVVTLLLVFVIPKFKEVFAEERMEMPAITQMLMSVSEIVQKWIWLFIILAFGLYVANRILLAKSEKYREMRDRLLLKIPVFGNMITKSLVARFARTFGTLIQSGVPHIEALEIVKGSVGNLVVRKSIEELKLSIQEGEGLSRPMETSEVFDDIVVNMVDVGEETGELDRMLLKIADRYDEEVDQKVSVLFKIIEPVIIVFLAGIVAVIIAALFLPMLELVKSLGKGA